MGAWVINNPQQDNIDQEAANVAETFLGISHMNCLLCHNGRGHLDALSLWGKSMTRTQAWGFASFLSHTTTTRVPLPTAVNNNPYYWAVRDDPRLFRTISSTRPRVIGPFEPRSGRSEP